MSGERGGKGFDAFASRYDEMLDDPARKAFARSPEFFIRVKWDHLRRWLEETYGAEALKTWRWLDAGCGRGTLLRMTSGSFGAAVGCDVSRGMLRLAEPGNLVQAAVVSLPFADAAFDLATMVCLLHHARPDEADAWIGETARVLRPGGLLAVAEHNPHNPVARRVVKRCPMDQAGRLTAMSETIDRCRRLGLKIVMKRYCLFLPDGLYRVAGGLERALGFCPLGGQYWVVARKAT